MAEKRIPEGELIVPAMEIISAAPDGKISTSELIKKLEDRFGPKGEDAEILQGRYDTKFSQKVRNLKSHKTLQRAGFVGKRWLDSLRGKS